MALHEGSLTALPLPDGALAGGISLNTIYFIDDLATVTAEIRRCLAPAGAFVLGLGDPDAMEKDPMLAATFRLRPIAEIEATLTNAGLDIARHERLGGDEFAFHLLRLRRTADVA
jgi:SAM-dependent methyltransferase